MNTKAQSFYTWCKRNVLRFTLITLLVFLATALTTSHALADDPTPVPLTEVGKSRQPVGQPNPWGCVGWSEYPHESTRWPGAGWIMAKSHIECDTPPPSNVEWEI